MTNVFPTHQGISVRRLGPFPDESYYFEPDSLRRLLSCGTYCLTKDREYLYIGSAKNVLARISDESHSSFRMALCEATQVLVRMAPSESGARHFEAGMIAVHQPKYNVTGKSKTSSFYKAIVTEYAIDEFKDTFAEELTKNLA